MRPFTPPLSALVSPAGAPRRGRAVAWARPAAVLVAVALALASSLGLAWESASAADPDFDFPAWLTRALREGWLAGIHPLTS